MKRHRATPVFKSLVIVYCALFCIGEVRADVIPLSSIVAPSANAGIGGTIVFQQPAASQGSTVVPLSASVDNAVVFPSGSPLLVGANCNPSAPDFCVSVDGRETATWTSAARGSVVFSNYGWQSHLSLDSLSPAVNGTANLVHGSPAGVGPNQFEYRFTADVSGTMDIHYTLAYSGTVGDVPPTTVIAPCFGLKPFFVHVSGGTGVGPSGDVGFNNECGTTSGDLVGQIDAGGSYLFSIDNQSNISGSFGNLSSIINAEFDFVIPSSTPVSPAQEPATLALFGVGLAALGWRRRRAT